MPSLQMTKTQEDLAFKLFGTWTPDKREGKTLLTVRFDVETHELFKGPVSGKRPRRVPLRDAVVLRYAETTAVTPTGGRYTRRALTVRTRDGRRWYGLIRRGTDVVKLRLAPEPEPTS